MQIDSAQDDEIARLHGRGYTTSHIAGEIRTTRNFVIGRLHALNLIGRSVKRVRVQSKDAPSGQDSKDD